MQLLLRRVLNKDYFFLKFFQKSVDFVVYRGIILTIFDLRQRETQKRKTSKA